MFFVVLGILLGLCCVYVFFREFGLEDFIDAMMALFFVIVAFIVGGMGGGLVAFVVGGLIPEERFDKVYERTYELVAMKDNVSVEGGIFLFGGYIDGDLKYYGYVKEDGGIRRKMFDADEYIITEVSTEAYVEDCHYSGYELFAIRLCHDGRIHVPVGSVTTDFEFDLQ